MTNFYPYTIHYFTKMDFEIYNFWIYFDKDENNGVRVVGTYQDVLDRAYYLLDNKSEISHITIYNDKLDNFFCEIYRNN